MYPTLRQQGLQDRGRRFVKRVERLLPRVGDENAAIKQAAKAEGEGVKEFRVAYDFARDVAAIELIVPGASKAIRRGDHPHLTPSIVFKLRRESEDRIKKAIAQASRGLHPSAPKPSLGLSPAQALWHYDLSRLRKAFDRVGMRRGPDHLTILRARYDWSCRNAFGRINFCQLRRFRNFARLTRRIAAC